MHDQPDLSDSTLTIFHKSIILFIWVYEYEENINAFGCGAIGIGRGYDAIRSICQTCQVMSTIMPSVWSAKIATSSLYGWSVLYVSSIAYNDEVLFSPENSTSVTQSCGFDWYTFLHISGAVAGDSRVSIVCFEI